MLESEFVSLFIARKSLHTDPRISNRGSLLGKRGSVRVGSALLSRKADSLLPFPDWGMRLRGNHDSAVRVVLLKCGAAADGRIGLLTLPTPSIPKSSAPIKGAFKAP